jgi:hypothetical protein
MICADCLAGAQLECGGSKTLLLALGRLYALLGEAEKVEFLQQLAEAV